MTIREAIERTDALKPNAVPKHDKTKWLADLDGRIAAEICNTHEGTEVEYTPYTDELDIGTELLVPPPYDEVYITWLSLNIDLVNREITSYNNNVALYNAQYTAFSRAFNRAHMPKSERLSFFVGRRRKRAVPDAAGTGF